MKRLAAPDSDYSVWPTNTCRRRVVRCAIMHLNWMTRQLSTCTQSIRVSRDHLSAKREKWPRKKARTNDGNTYKRNRAANPDTMRRTSSVSLLLPRIDVPSATFCPFSCDD